MQRLTMSNGVGDYLERPGLLTCCLLLLCVETTVFELIAIAKLSDICNNNNKLGLGLGLLDCSHQVNDTFEWMAINAQPTCSKAVISSCGELSFCVLSSVKREMCSMVLKKLTTS